MQTFASISLSPAASDGAAPFVFSLTGAIPSAAVMNQLKAVLLRSYWISNASEQKKRWTKQQPEQVIQEKLSKVKIRMLRMNPHQEREAEDELGTLFQLLSPKMNKHAAGWRASAFIINLKSTKQQLPQQ